MISYVFILIHAASATSTFVGNGGSSYDVEIRGTLKQIYATVDELSAENVSRFCRCPVNSNAGYLCDRLQQLDKRQIGVCQQTLLHYREQLRLYSSGQSPATFRWTEEPIRVLEGADTNSVEAVANRSDQTITFNREAFDDMDAEKRIVLIVHEILHLVSTPELPDDKPVTGFETAGGGRKLLDTVGMAVATQAIDGGHMQVGSRQIRVSKLDRRNWLDLEFGVQNKLSGDSARLAEDSGNFSNLRYRRQLEGGLGLYIQSNSAATEGSRLDVTITEELSWTGAGASFVYIPVEDSLEPISQSHFVGLIGLDRVTASYEVADSSGISLRSETDFVAIFANLSYFYPLRSGFWFNLNLAIRQLDYQHEIAGETIRAQKWNSLGSFGVSYGF